VVTAGELLRETRQRHGLTQRQLADRARTSQAAISRIERDLVSPSVESLAELLDRMGEELLLTTRKIDYQINNNVLRENLELSAGERIDQGVLLARLARGEGSVSFPSEPTLHLEIARLLHEQGNVWMTTPRDCRRGQRGSALSQEAHAGPDNTVPDSRPNEELRRGLRAKGISCAPQP